MGSSGEERKLYDDMRQYPVTQTPRETGYDEVMAALPEPHAEPDRPISQQLVELRHIEADRLTPLLDEEIAAWRTELDWDFRPSADLVRRFVHMQALSGFALVTNTGGGPRVDGYSYFVCEEGKGLIGDLYVMREYRTPQHENALLETVLDALWRTPGVKRVESQLLMLSSPLERAIPRREYFRCTARQFLEAPLAFIEKLKERSRTGIGITRWTERMQDQTARLIASAYQGHVDARINDQYRSPAGARRFLMNIVQYPGCGTFFAPASYAAFDTTTRQLCGVSLASLVSSDCGHITQLCVAKTEQGTGLGYELIRQSLMALRAHGCDSVSLTVTGSNDNAIRLYRSMGFTKRRDFGAYVWDRRDSGLLV
jgi:ribosomal protein S18 acetylase RimI-like enzyme